MLFHPCQIAMHDTRYEIVMVHFHGKVRNLAHVGVPAVRVSELNRDSLELVAAGNFRFGTLLPPVI